MVSANAGPLPLLPPPPPQTPSPTKASLLAHLPPECRPKADSLMHLMVNIDNDVCFDQEERQKLRESDVGSELVRILQYCKETRARTMTSMKVLEESNDEEDQKSHQMNLLRFQTCLLRTSCPSRMKKFEQCWTNVSRRMMRDKRQYAVSRLTCQSERQALERCAGDIVAQSVREAMEDSLGEDDDHF